MFNSSIDLGKTVEAKDLFDALVNSDYMKRRGYGILYASTYYENKKKKVRKGGITITKSAKGKVESYGLCYNHDNELLYIHIRISEVPTTSSFTYSVTLGDEKRIEADLVELAKEIKNKI